MTTGRINQIAIAIPRRRRRVVMVCLTGLAWSPAQRYPPPSYHLVWFSVALMLVGSFTLLKEARVTLSRDKQLTSAVTSFSLTASRRHLLVSFIIRHQLVPSIQSRSVWESAIYIYMYDSPSKPSFAYQVPQSMPPETSFTTGIEQYMRSDNYPYPISGTDIDTITRNGRQ